MDLRVLLESPQGSQSSSQWGHARALSSRVVAAGSFQMSQFFASSGQSTGVSALASFFPRNPRADLLQNGLVGSPCSPRDSQESFPTPQFKSTNSLAISFLYGPTLTSIALTRWTFVSKVIFPLFNIVSRFFIAFIPRRKCLLISWLQSPSAVILEPQKKSLTLFPLFPHLFTMK